MTSLPVPPSLPVHQDARQVGLGAGIVALVAVEDLLDALGDAHGASSELPVPARPSPARSALSPRSQASSRRCAARLARGRAPPGARAAPRRRALRAAAATAAKAGQARIEHQRALADPQRRHGLAGRVGAVQHVGAAARGESARAWPDSARHHRQPANSAAPGADSSVTGRPGPQRRPSLVEPMHHDRRDAGSCLTFKPFGA